MNEQPQFEIQALEWNCHRQNCSGVHRATVYPHEEKAFDSLAVDCMVCGTKSTLRHDRNQFYVQGHNEIGVSTFRATVTRAFSTIIDPDEFGEIDLYPSEPYDLFEGARDDLNDLRRGSPGSASKPLLRKVLFQQYITLLEAFLSDTFTRVANRSTEAISDVIMELDAFKDSKVSYRELAVKPYFLREKVIEHLTNVSWHDLKRANQISKTMLSASIFVDDNHKERLLAAVRIRHDLVHRNGKAKDGSSHTIDDDTLRTLAVDVDNAARQVTEAYNAWLFRRIQLNGQTA